MKNFTLKQQYVVLVIIFCLFIIFFLKYSTLSSFSFLTITKEIEEEKPLPIAIEIVGEVEKPGIYCFENEVSVGEVIERAGGLKDNSVLAKDCFSMKVSNGTKITIGDNPSSFMIKAMEPEKCLIQKPQQNGSR